ncbi:MAG: transcriptional repressor [Bacteroidota bacterium]
MKRRNTPTQKEILKVLKTTGSGMSYEMIKSHITDHDRSTVYRILNRFCEDGLAHRIVGDNGKQFFIYGKNPDGTHLKHYHFHFQCELCGTMECLNQAIEVNLPEGYSMTSFNGVIKGRCTNCA